MKLVAKSVEHQPQQELAWKHSPADSHEHVSKDAAFILKATVSISSLHQVFFSLINIVHVVGVTAISL